MEQPNDRRKALLLLRDVRRRLRTMTRSQRGDVVCILHQLHRRLRSLEGDPAGFPALAADAIAYTEGVVLAMNGVAFGRVSAREWLRTYGGWRSHGIRRRRVASEVFRQGVLELGLARKQG